jgi:hypothetical protein
VRFFVSLPTMPVLSCFHPPMSSIVLSPTSYERSYILIPEQHTRVNVLLHTLFRVFAHLLSCIYPPDRSNHRNRSLPQE